MRVIMKIILHQYKNFVFNFLLRMNFGLQS